MIEQLLTQSYAFKQPKVQRTIRGFDNDIFYFTSDQKRFVARVGKRKGKPIDFEAELIDLLIGQELPAPRIIRTRDGGTHVFMKDGHQLTVFEYVPGKSIDPAGSSSQPTYSREAGRLLGRFHSITTDIQLVHQTDRTIFTEFERILKNPRSLRTIEGRDRFLEDLKVSKQWAESQSGLSGIVHNDFIPPNVFFSGSKITAILDFDWACPGPLTKDLGIALSEWSFPDGAEKHRQKTFDSFIDGYNESAPEKVDGSGSVINDWIRFSLLSDACTFFADLTENHKISDASQCRRYRKYRYFSALATANG